MALSTCWLDGCRAIRADLNVTDLQAGNVFCTQEYLLWKDALNPYGSSVKLTYTAAFPFIYTTSADGNEAFLALANANPLLDRPVTVTGQPFDIHSKNSALIVAVNKAWKLIFIPVRRQYLVRQVRSQPAESDTARTARACAAKRAVQGHAGKRLLCCSARSPTTCCASKRAWCS